MMDPQQIDPQMLVSGGAQPQVDPSPLMPSPDPSPGPLSPSPMQPVMPDAPPSPLPQVAPSGLPQFLAMLKSASAQQPATRKEIISNAISDFMMAIGQGLSNRGRGGQSTGAGAAMQAPFLLAQQRKQMAFDRIQQMQKMAIDAMQAQAQLQNSDRPRNIDPLSPPGIVADIAKAKALEQIKPTPVRNIDPLSPEGIGAAVARDRQEKANTPIKPEDMTPEERFTALRLKEAITLNNGNPLPLGQEAIVRGKARGEWAGFGREQKDNSIQTIARIDRSFNSRNAEINKEAEAVSAGIQRVGRLIDTIDTGSPIADSVTAPELMVVMAGGQGSGVRITQAEITNIMGGQSKWQQMKAALNQWNTDPVAANKILAPMRGQIRALVAKVNEKLQAKEAIIESARQQLIDTDEIKQHQQIVADAKAQLAAIDMGKQYVPRGTNAPPVTSQGTTRMSKPDGKQVDVPNANVPAALKLGGKIIR